MNDSGKTGAFLYWGERTTGGATKGLEVKWGIPQNVNCLDTVGGSVPESLAGQWVT